LKKPLKSMPVKNAAAIVTLIDDQQIYAFLY
jgi:hypothetical protein